jgi:anhydro-N-acetylmuramic acid kinase
MTQFAVGLMSGTSCDGVDAALVRITGPCEAELVAYVVRPYSVDERNHIRSVVDSGGSREVSRLNFTLGRWFAEAVESVLSAGKLASAELSFISSHGHTIWHEPGTDTLQAGEAAVLAERFGVPVVSDFRVRDVAAGGQGAPLVPIADVELFAGAGNRVLLNLGGMANITWVPSPIDQASVVAFDTGPGMSLLDAIVRKEFPGENFDASGTYAAAGAADSKVVRTLLSDSYFGKMPPKSTGRELFGDAYSERLCDLVREANGDASAADLLATAVELTARSISDQLAVLDGSPAELVVSGGGARNVTLVKRLRELNSQVEVKLFGESFFDGDAKEAVAFAYLGWLTLAGKPGNLVGVTGAAGRRVLGKVTPA